MSGLVRIAVAWAIVSGAVIDPLDRRQAHADVSVDEILGSLAEVVADRARKTAARTIKRHLVDRFCSERELDLGKLVVVIGGSKACKAASSSCTSDDVFVRTCKLLRRNALGLTDPHLLKTAGKEAIAFLFRVTSSQLPKETYDSYGLPSFADNAFVIAEALIAGEPVASSLADTIDEVATKVERDFPAKTMAWLAAAPDADGKTAIIELYRETRTWLATCSAGDPVCDAFNGGGAASAQQWTIDLAANADECSTWEAGATARSDAFYKLFGATAPYANYAEDKVCPDATCKLGRVLYNLLDHASKLVCVGKLGKGKNLTALRQVAYIHSQRKIYEGILPAGNGLEAFRAYMKVVADVPTDDLLAAELAASLRVVASAIRASVADASGLASWFSVLRNDARTFANSVQAGDAALHAFLTGDALSTLGKHALSPEVRALRDDVKSLLVLPYLALAKGVDRVAATVELFEAHYAAIAAFIVDLKVAAQGSDLRTLIANMGRLLNSLGNTGEKLGAESAARYLDRKATNVSLALAAGVDVAELGNCGADCLEGKVRNIVKLVAMTIGRLSAVIDLISKRDWVGLALALSDELDAQLGDDVEPLSKSLRFLNVLMSMYQAESVEDAKAIFAATLDDEANREERYPTFTVDVAALVGVAFGSGLDEVEDDAMDDDGFWDDVEDHGLFGIYAPFGVQIAKGWKGVMIYPIDLGAYLVASTDDDITWHEAVRPGMVLYARPWQTVPIDAFVAADFQPGFGEQAKTGRLMLGMGLELPLFAIH